MTPLAAFTGLELHDSTLTSLHFNFEKKEIEIEVELFDNPPEGVEVEPDYYTDPSHVIIIRLHFAGVSNLRLGEITEVGSEGDMEIYRTDFVELSTGLYKATFLILLGFSMSSWTFSFEFTGGSVNGV